MKLVLHNKYNSNVVYADKEFIGDKCEIVPKISKKIIELSSGRPDKTGDFFEISIILKNKLMTLILPVNVVYKIKRRFYIYSDDVKMDVLVSTFCNIRSLILHIFKHPDGFYNVHNIITRTFKHKIPFKFVLSHKEDTILKRDNFVIASIMDADKLPYLDSYSSKLYIPSYYANKTIEKINTENKIVPLLDNIRDDKIYTLSEAMKYIEVFNSEVWKRKTKKANQKVNQDGLTTAS